VAPRIAVHFSQEHQAMGTLTLRELAVFYGVTRSTMRKALRLAEPLFHSQGLALRVPERDSGWVIVSTDDQLEYDASTVYRLRAMLVEAARFEANEQAVAAAGSTLIFSGFADSIQDFLDTLIGAVTP